MSKKELLNETQIRRFMKLANLEPLAKNVLSEMQAEVKKEEEMPAPAMQEEMNMEEEGEGMEVELDDAEGSAGGGDVDAKAVVKATVDALVAGLKQAGLDVGDISVEDEEEGGEDEEGAAGMEDEMPMDDKAGAEKEEEEEEEGEMQEAASLSEDALVEAVLTRVTARLMEEAKKASAKKGKKPAVKGVADKMAKKKAEKPVAPATLEEATSAEGGGPLLKQGKNKHDVYKGHADMAYAKGKEGKGGHQMETVTAKAEHTVTHGGKNLATLGGNKKKV